MKGIKVIAAAAVFAAIAAPVASAESMKPSSLRPHGSTWSSLRPHGSTWSSLRPAHAGWNLVY